MKKLRNPFNELPGYNCFGCSSANTHGLNMEFHEDGEEIVSKWIMDPGFQGFINVLHGGIQSTLMDEIASWVVFIKLKTGGVTSAIQVKFRKPVLVTSGNVTLRAKLKEDRGRIAVIEVKLFNGENILCSEAVVDYFVLSHEKAREKMSFPGVEAFYYK